MQLARDVKGILYTQAAVVTPHDSNANVYSGLYVGTALAALTVQLQGDTAAVCFSAVAAGTVLPISVSLVKSTGTSAGSIIGLK